MLEKEIELIEIGYVFVFSFLLSFFVFFVFKDFFVTERIAILFSQSFSFLLVCLIYYKIKFEVDLKQILFSKVSFDDIKYSFKIFVYCLFADVFFLTLAYFFIKNDNPVDYDLRLNLCFSERLVYVLVFIIIGPIAEEMFSRGIVYNFLRQHFSVIPSIIISSLFFVFLHGTGVARFIDVFIVGFFLAYSYEKKKKLLVPILVHSLINFFGYVIGTVLIIIL